MNIEKETKEYPCLIKLHKKIHGKKYKKLGEKVKVEIKNITDKAIFAEIVDSIYQVCSFKEISYKEDAKLKNFKKDQILDVKIIDVKDDKIRFLKRALEKDPLDWLKIITKKSEI